jgi:hypothetical protein
LKKKVSNARAHLVEAIRGYIEFEYNFHDLDREGVKKRVAELLKLDNFVIRPLELQKVVISLSESS